MKRNPPQILVDFKKQNHAIKIMTISDFFEVCVCSFCGPIMNKMIFSNDGVTSHMLALSNLIVCIMILFWNWVFKEEKRYEIFRKTYIPSLILYSSGMILCSLLTIHFKNILIWFWMEMGISSTVGRLLFNGNMELFGNLFSTEERKTYERTRSSIMACAEIIGMGGAVFISINVYGAMVIWGISYIMDIISMSYVYRWCDSREMLKPRISS